MGDCLLGVRYRGVLQRPWDILCCVFVFLWQVCLGNDCASGISVDIFWVKNQSWEVLLSNKTPKHVLHSGTNPYMGGNPKIVVHPKDGCIIINNGKNKPYLKMEWFGRGKPPPTIFGNFHPYPLSTTACWWWWVHRPPRKTRPNPDRGLQNETRQELEEVRWGSMVQKSGDHHLGWC